MSVPTYDQFIEPLLRYLVQHLDGVPAKLAHEATATALRLSDEDRQLLLPSGAQPMYKNRAGWAHDRLKRASLSSSPRRGFWKVTSEGVAFANEHPAPFPAELSEKLAMGYVSVRLRAASPAATTQALPQSTPTELSAAVASPDDRLGQALANFGNLPKLNCWNFSRPSRHLSSRQSFSICFTAWATARAAQTSSALVGPAMVVSTVLSRWIASDSRRSMSKPSASRLTSAVLSSRRSTARWQARKRRRESSSLHRRTHSKRWTSRNLSKALFSLMASAWRGS
jgi:hypothetical protein